MDAKTVLLDAQHLTKTFKAGKGRVQAISDVSLQIHRGETLALVGESGCGKSTLGRLLLRLIEPDAGTVTLDGTDVTALKKKDLRLFRKRMQLIFQDPYASLDPRYTVEEIIAEPLRAYGIRGAESHEIVLDLAHKVGINPEHLSRYPHQFSGGQRQRIGIARAIALNPNLVVCDEPVSALDVSIQAQTLNLLHDLQKSLGLTYLFISHDLGVVHY
ncbi:MAG TPA: dipeptide/oligopeptide/nickel ABC transporter ATP-binding protein, partial [Candidatus Limiplasma sp.]|nr:dipeptide/oligopeptide/nickel ABC transporter ATP-binding protein [Candidatus Limiplasma sp.]